MAEFNEKAMHDFNQKLITESSSAALSPSRSRVARVVGFELTAPPPAVPGPFQGPPGRHVGLLGYGHHRVGLRVPAERERGERGDRRRTVALAGQRRIADQVVDPGRAAADGPGEPDGPGPAGIVVDQVPLTSVMKIDRKRLRAMLTE